jgi:hypothetical protein
LRPISKHTAAVGAAGLAELVWRAPAGGPPVAVGVVPLLLGGQPAVAMTWAHAGLARSAAASPQAALVLSEPRLAGTAWEPLAARGRLTLLEDADGSLFTEELLAQELRKHPPARALADSSLVRREHWWYLPRLVLLLEAPEVVPLRSRTAPSDAVLAVDDDGLHVVTVRVPDWEAAPLVVRQGPSGAAGPAVLVGQEVSVPDAERWTVHVTTGRYEDGALAVSDAPSTRRLEAVPGLLARVRRQRALERACVRALRAEGHG